MTYSEFIWQYASYHLLPVWDKENCYPGSSQRMLYLSREIGFSDDSHELIPHFALFSEEIAAEYEATGRLDYVLLRDTEVDNITETEDGGASYYVWHPDMPIEISNRFHGLFHDPVDFAREVIRVLDGDDAPMKEDAMIEYVRRSMKEDREWFSNYYGTDAVLPGLAMARIAIGCPLLSNLHNPAMRLAMSYLSRLYLAYEDGSALFLIAYLLYSQKCIRGLMIHNDLNRVKFLMCCLDETFDCEKHRFKFHSCGLDPSRYIDEDRMSSLYERSRASGLELTAGDWRTFMRTLHSWTTY